MNKLTLTLLAAGFLSATATAAMLSTELAHKYHLDPTKTPAQNFNMKNWKLNLPELTEEGKRKGKLLEISKEKLADTDTPYVHPDWFYTDKQTGAVIFVTPNKAPTTPNSHNTRSELRAMLAAQANDPENNFVIASHPDAEKYGAIGGELKATLSVDHVSVSGNHSKNGAFAVVIGQIHASRNEPLKILYRKLPEHDYGSLAWSYELNPTKALQDGKDKYGKKLRQDIRHNVFGKYNLRKGDTDPQDGIKLGELFSYRINVKGDIMHLTFTRHPGEADEIIKTFAINLAEGKYQGHEVDQGYANDWMYYKAGVYNQCNTNKNSSDCKWRGMEAGDYTQASFYQLELNQ